MPLPFQRTAMNSVSRLKREESPFFDESNRPPSQNKDPGMAMMKTTMMLLCLTMMPIVTGASVAQNWVTLFDGKSMKGWRLMAVHGGRGGIWVVDKGALVADQDKDHTGGLVATEKKYSDFEIELEFQADFPVDTGLFLRTR